MFLVLVSSRSGAAAGVETEQDDEATCWFGCGKDKVAALRFSTMDFAAVWILFVASSQISMSSVNVVFLATVL